MIIIATKLKKNKTKQKTHNYTHKKPKTEAEFPF